MEPGADRARSRRRGHRRRAGGEETARRGLRGIRRARRRLRQARRRASRARGRQIAASGSENTDHAARDRRRRVAARAVGCRRRQAVGRREAARRALPHAALQARHAASRRAHQPPRRGKSVDWLEQFLSRFPGTVVAITHDRYFLDNAAEWILELDRGSGIPYKGNYSPLAGAEGSPPRAGAEDRRRTHQGDEEGTRVGTAEPEGAPGQEQGAPRPLRGAVRCRIPEAQRDQRDLHSGRRAARPRGDRIRRTCRRASATDCSSTTSASRFRPARSSASSARTAPASRRCSA